MRSTARLFRPPRKNFATFRTEVKRIRAAFVLAGFQKRPRSYNAMTKTQAIDQSDEHEFK